MLKQNIISELEKNPSNGINSNYETNGKKVHNIYSTFVIYFYFHRYDFFFSRWNPEVCSDRERKSERAGDLEKWE